ncbi:cilia- and flagella-associated protein 298 [Peromyscus eremicus]|uniref:cilia- and flagella-associated protein 298 n=1 Tax=Peromyscus eremicus TaxID=42410 RepID=UPI0027DDCE95|nr:cilia- and flagella-associated protein 298 [Peromyscus eremicus]
MVVLHVKRGDESQFLLQAPGSTELEELTAQVTRVYNGRLKVQRLCTEVEELAAHGVFLPPNMQGLTDEQIQELKLKDEWGEKCVPSGGSHVPEAGMLSRCCVLFWCDFMAVSWCLPTQLVK